MQFNLVYEALDLLGRGRLEIPDVGAKQVVDPPEKMGDRWRVSVTWSVQNEPL